MKQLYNTGMDSLNFISLLLTDTFILILYLNLTIITDTLNEVLHAICLISKLTCV